MSDGIEVPPYLKDPYPEYIPESVDISNIGERIPVYIFDEDGVQVQIGTLKVVSGLSATGALDIDTPFQKALYGSLDDFSIHYKNKEKTDGSTAVS